MESLTAYRYGGARALVMLHEQQLTSFVATWRQARDVGISIPETDDPDYVSLERILWHVLVCAGSYLRWMCEKLELPDPGIRLPPRVEDVTVEADAYLTHLLDRWRKPLANVSEKQCYQPEYTSAWGAAYCIDAMLEHAVMHPLRHRFQLEQWLHQQGQDRAQTGRSAKH